MTLTYTVNQARTSLSQLLEQAEEHIIAIKRRRKTVAYVVTKEMLICLFETAELLANPSVMCAIHEARNGRTQSFPLPKEFDDVTQRKAKSRRKNASKSASSAAKS